MLPARGHYLDTRNISEIAVIGGTHGNERTGVHVIQYIQEHPEEFTFGSITSIRGLFGNPRAIRRNSRFMDTDLNRSFNFNYVESKPLPDPGSAPYETYRALEIREQLGAMEKPYDFLIDLHTTTSNMKNCVIVSDDDPWTEALCANLISKIPHGRVLLEKAPRELEKTSSSLGLNHVTLEVGPVPQGETDYKKIEAVIRLVKEIVKCVEALNGKKILSPSPIPHLYSPLTYKVDYPRDGNGFPTAVIHRDFKHQDYKPLEIGAPIFTLFNGTKIVFDTGKYFPESLVTMVKEGREVCPVFIGEAAYIDKGQAFIPTQPLK